MSYKTNTLKKQTHAYNEVIDTEFPISKYAPLKTVLFYKSNSDIEKQISLLINDVLNVLSEKKYKTLKKLL